MSDRPIVAGANWAAWRRKEADATREKKQGADLIAPPIYQSTNAAGTRRARAVKSEIKLPSTQITMCARQAATYRSYLSEPQLAGGREGS